MPINVRHVPRHELVAASIALVVGVLLCALKFAAYFMTGSAAVFSDALESIVNVLAAGFALYALGVAHTPADARHPYGHGKIEFVSAGFEGGMIVIAGAVISLRAVEELWSGSGIHVNGLDWGLALVGLATCANAFVGVQLVRAGRRHGSITLEAGGWHLLSDAITSTGVLVALAVVRVTGWSPADPIAALLVAAYIVAVGLRLLRRSAAGLMDEQDLEDERILRELLDAHVGPAGREPRVCSYHKLRHRHSGRYHWVEFHLVVPARWNVEQGHEAAGAIEGEIERALGEGNATAHVEPCVTPGCESCAPSPEQLAAEK